MLMNIIIILVTFVVINYAYEKSKNFKSVVDEITRLANWGLFILTALVAIAVIYFSQG